MSWVNSRQFKISNRLGRHYVFHRNNAGNTEINIPASITTKAAAVRWLKAHPNKLTRKKATPPPHFGPFTKHSPPRKHSPYAQARSFNTKERKNFAKYLAKLPFSSSPKYGAESPTMRALRRAALKSEGQKVSPSPPRSKFSCSGKKLTKIIGKGRQGIIYEGSGFAAKVCPRDLRAARHGEKQPAKVEFDIQQAAHTAAPNGVVGVYWIQKCKNFIPPSAMNMANVQDSKAYDKSEQTVIFMEYCSGGSLSGWLNEKPRTDAVLHHVIKSVVTTIAKIQKDYPDFRHNDLHLDNVLVANRGFLIGDFGWAHIKKSGTNPAVNTANKTGVAGQWGVGPKTDPRYDHHMFLNNLRSWVVNKGGFPTTKAFLDMAVPIGYRGPTDLHVKEWRLKYNDPCPGLPSLSQLLKTKYITGRKFSSPNLVAARAKLKKVVAPRVKRIRSANLRAAKAKLRKVNPPVKRVRSANRKPVVFKKNETSRKATRANIGVASRKRVPIPRAVLKSNAFNRLVEKIRTSQSPKKVITSQGTFVNETYNNARNRARTKAMIQVENRINRGMDPFSQSPLKPKPKMPSPPKPKNLSKLVPLVNKPPIILVKTKPAAPKPNRPKAILLNAPVNNKYRRSPKSGRMKMKAPSGRWVYVNLHSTLADLKKIAANKGKNITGLKTKADIIRKIFS